MKTRERIKQIRKAPHWTKKLWLARDVAPGTTLDLKLFAVREAFQRRKYNLAVLRDAITDLGEELALAVHLGDPTLFRAWADAIEANKNHKPFPDKLRAALTSFCVPPNRTFIMRDIVQHLQGLKLISKNLKGADLVNAKRNLYRVCGELGITVEGESGRPKQIATRTRMKSGAKVVI